MSISVSVIITVIILVLFFGDILTNKILTNKYIASILLLPIVHISILFNNFGKQFANKAYIWIVFAEICLFLVYFGFKICIFPIIKEKDMSSRSFVIMSGRRLIYYGIILVLSQSLIMLFSGYYIKKLNLTAYIYKVDCIVAWILIILLISNGYIRIFMLSKRLRILRRIVVSILIWIPIVNIFVLLYLCSIANIEYDHECNKIINYNARVDSSICKTKYPIIMLHGVGFKDLKYINYWGRIPKELIRNGATIYYGNQEAWGTVKNNSEDIRNKIFEILKETKSEKVNIIAHSKGGLDARYTISTKDVAPHVASLTTISTPHRGCKMVDLACKIPAPIFSFIGKISDYYYRKIGDKNPEFCAAVKQFSTKYLEEFNSEIKDVNIVYYQSYTSVMKSALSDFLLAIPFMITKKCEGENDGLVSVESSKWGEFRGVFRNKHTGGISHGDIIDLTREDYRGFDTIETFIQIVSELKEMGF